MKKAWFKAKNSHTYITLVCNHLTLEMFDPIWWSPVNGRRSEKDAFACCHQSDNSASDWLRSRSGEDGQKEWIHPTLWNCGLHRAARQQHPPVRVDDGHPWRQEAHPEHQARGSLDPVGLHHRLREPLAAGVADRGHQRPVHGQHPEQNALLSGVVNNIPSCFFRYQSHNLSSKALGSSI